MPPLQSDLTLDATKFDPKAISQQTHDFNDTLIKMNGPKWWEVGAEKYRQVCFRPTLKPFTH